MIKALEICSKLTSFWCHFVNFEHISHFYSAFVLNFEQVKRHHKDRNFPFNFPFSYNVIICVFSP